MMLSPTTTHLIVTLWTALNSELLWPGIAALFIIAWGCVRFPHIISRSITRLVTRIVLQFMELIAVITSLLILGGTGLQRLQTSWTSISEIDHFASVTPVNSLKGSAKWLAENQSLWIGLSSGVVVGILVVYVLKSRSYGSKAGNHQQLPYQLANKDNPHIPSTTIPYPTPLVIHTAPAQSLENNIHQLLPITNRLRVLEEQISQLITCVNNISDDLTTRPTTDLLLALFTEETEARRNPGCVESQVNLVAEPVVNSPLEVIDISSDDSHTISNNEITQHLKQENTQNHSFPVLPTTPPPTISNTTEIRESNRKQSDLIDLDMLKDYVGLPKEEFFKRIATQAKEHREVGKRPMTLTLEEQTLGQTSLKDLDLKWKQDEGIFIKPSHLEPIGTLTAQEAQFSRRAIKEIIRVRRHLNWVETMKAKGIPLRVCENCSQTVTNNHRYMTTNWARRVRRGPITGKSELLITQQGKGAVRLQRQYRTDQEQLEKNLKQLQERQYVLSEQQQRALANIPQTGEYRDLAMQIDEQGSASTSLNTGHDQNQNLVVPAPIALSCVTGYPLSLSDYHFHSTGTTISPGQYGASTNTFPPGYISSTSQFIT